MIGQLHPIDWIAIAGFFVVQAYLGFSRSRRSRSGADAIDYLLGGRHLTLPAFVASLVSTWYGGILGVGEYSFRYGVSNWLVFGVPYYLWAVVFALWLARHARRTQYISLPDHLGAAYGRGPGLAGAIVVFVMTVPAAYVLMLGQMGTLLLGWPQWYGIALGAILSSVYLITGGFRAAIRVDLMQFACMFGGFALILPFTMSEYGGWRFLADNLPATHLTWHGGNSGWFVASWYFIALSTLVEPAFYQRCYATQDESTARRGVLWSVAFWILFDFMTTTTGLYARAVMPELETPASSYPALAIRILPPGVLGLFMVGLLATIVSTVDSYMFIAATALGRDILSRLRPLTDHAVRAATRWSIPVSALLAVLIALASGSVIGIWRDLGSIGVPMILLPVLMTFRRASIRVASRLVVAWIVLPGLVAGAWIIVRIATGQYPLGLEPIFPGLATSILCACLTLVLRRGGFQTRSRTSHAQTRPV